MNTTTKTTRIDRMNMISHSPAKLVDEIIVRANSEKASDIHIEPGEHECRVRIRVDGDLVVLGNYRKEIHEEAVARLKVLSSLRTDVRLSPQDGRFKVTIGGQALHIRISVIPSLYGEKCVLRLLPQTVHTHTLGSLGFGVRDQEILHSSLSLSHGMILVVGPTGSGKTTTLYALLQKILSPEISVVTLEDPIEYSIPGLTQIPIHNGSTMTFATALRAVVRQDPDVIMVGEIRDSSTAELSTHAALTGHVVISTLHTNDAVTALPRLIDMGIEPFLVASTVRLVVSQRLVRRVCEKCSTEIPISTSEMEYLEKHRWPMKNVPKNILKGRGCGSCRNSGYSGRTVLSEILTVNERIRNLILQRASADKLRTCATENGDITLSQDSIAKVLSGVTTFEEIASLTGI